MKLKKLKLTVRKIGIHRANIHTNIGHRSFDQRIVIECYKSHLGLLFANLIQYRSVV